MFVSFCSAVCKLLGLSILKLCKRTLKLGSIFKVSKMPKKVAPEEKAPVAPPVKVEVPAAAKGIYTPDYN